MCVAAAQVRPCWLNPTATTTKVISWIEEAAAQNVELVAFPETFLSGYPFWLELTGGARLEDVKQKRAYAAYLGAAVEMEGPQIRQITEKCAISASSSTSATQSARLGARHCVLHLGGDRPGPRCCQHPPQADAYA